MIHYIIGHVKSTDGYQQPKKDVYTSIKDIINEYPRCTKHNLKSMSKDIIEIQFKFFGITETLQICKTYVDTSKKYYVISFPDKKILSLNSLNELPQDIFLSRRQRNILCDTLGFYFGYTSYKQLFNSDVGSYYLVRKTSHVNIVINTLLKKYRMKYSDKKMLLEIFNDKKYSYMSINRRLEVLEDKLKIILDK